MKQHDLLIAVVEPVLLYGSFRLSDCFPIDFSCKPFSLHYPKHITISFPDEMRSCIFGGGNAL
jgi:hypothetical protein